MKMNILKKSFFTLLSIAMMANALYAGKLVSSESYLKQIEQSVISLQKKLEEFRIGMDGINTADSFVKTDFWGMQPTWYVSNGFGNVITTNYPYVPTWMNAVSGISSDFWAKNRGKLVRDINGIIFTPVDERYLTLNRKDPRGWGGEVSFEISIDYHPNHRDSYDYLQYIKKEFIKNGVQDVDKALTYLNELVDPATILIEKNLYTTYDGLVQGCKNGYDTVYNNIGTKLERAKKLDAATFANPLKHPEIFNEDVFKRYDAMLYPKSIKAFHSMSEEKYANKSMFDYYVSQVMILRLNVPIQYFKIAGDLSKNKQYNQLKQLKSLLESKVQSQMVIKKEQGKYTVYEDANGYLKGRIGVDYKSGLGYWQLPIWDAKDTFLVQIQEMQKMNNNLNMALKRFLELSLQETVNKFKSNTARTNDF